MRIVFFCTILFLSLTGLGQNNNSSPLPTRQQLAWHEMEFYLFAHFGPNTFTDKEWGEGNEPENLFNPSQLDCRQWCRVAKAAGAKGIIITAKHHLKSLPRDFLIEIPEELAGEIMEADSRHSLEIGVKWASKQVEELLNFGVPAVHFYILQNIKPIKMLFNKLKIM